MAAVCHEHASISPTGVPQAHLVGPARNPLAKQAEEREAGKAQTCIEPHQRSEEFALCRGEDRLVVDREIH